VALPLHQVAAAIYLIAALVAALGLALLLFAVVGVELLT